MVNPRFPFRFGWPWSQSLEGHFGVFIVVVGVGVAVGWWTHQPWLVQISQAFAPMQFNTALGFIFSGIALVCLSRGQITACRAFGAVPLLLGVLTLLQYAFDADFGIDRFFIEPFVATQTSHPGRPSPIAAFCFVLMGLAFFQWSKGNTWREYLAVIFGMTVVSVGLMGILGYLFSAEAAYGWGQLARMALHTALLFVFLSAGLIRYVWRTRENPRMRIPAWFAPAVAAGATTCSILIWTSLRSHESLNIERATDSVGKNVSQLIGARISEQVLALQRMADRVAHIRMTKEEWVADARNYVRDMPGLQSVVRADEAAKVQWVFPESGIRDTPQIHRALAPSHGRLVATGKHDRTPMMTDAFELALGNKVFLLASPIFNDEGLRGYIIGVVRHDELLKAILPPEILQQNRLAVLQSGSEVFSGEAGSATLPQLLRTRDFQVLGTDWALRLTPTRDSLADVSSRNPEIALTVGLFTAIVLTLAAWLTQVTDAQRVALERNARELAEGKNAVTELARIKSEFLANMSHEIRTPMTAVIGMTDLLLDSPLSMRQRDFVETIQGAGDELLSVINEILDFSMLESQKLKLEKTDYNLRSTVESAIDMVALAFSRKGIELGLMIADGVPPGLVGDPTRLKQVLVNFLGNAVKFTEKGGVFISVWKVSQDNDQVVVRFEVKDSGIVISDQAVARLFQPFAQAEASTARRFGGTGLGLVISKRLVEMMGGAVGFHSKHGEGTTFWFIIPQGISTDAAATTTPPQPDFQGRKALIVDDNPTNLVIVEQQLANLGIACNSAVDSARAFELLKRQAAIGKRFDLVIADYVMPEIDGLGLAQLIRSDPVVGSTPVIILTSYAYQIPHERLEKLHISSVLTKPVKQSHLYRDVSLALGSARPDTLDAAAEKPRGVRGCRVLLVDDNPANQKIAAHQLQNLGCEVRVAGDGRQALELLNAEAFDVVLMDCVMPVMDGYEATRAIRQREGETRHTQIIAMTASSLDSDRKRCLESGMDDCITKPITSKELEKVIQGFVARFTA